MVVVVVVMVHMFLRRRRREKSRGRAGDVRSGEGKTIDTVVRERCASAQINDFEILCPGQ